MIPRKFEPVLFGLFLSGLMSLVVSGIATARTLGFHEGVVSHWMQSWLTAWLVAFPIVLLAAPAVRRLVHRLVAD